VEMKKRVGSRALGSLISSLNFCGGDGTCGTTHRSVFGARRWKPIVCYFWLLLDRGRFDFLKPEGNDGRLPGVDGVSNAPGTGTLPHAGDTNG
jgi:hypothetical protein